MDLEDKGMSHYRLKWMDGNSHIEFVGMVARGEEVRS